MDLTPNLRTVLRSAAEREMVTVINQGVPALLDALEAAERFKAFVHSYLDSHGVPYGDPDNAHQKEGCRIGARLDLLFAQRDAAEKREAALRAALEAAEAENARLRDVTAVKSLAAMRAALGLAPQQK